MITYQRLIKITAIAMTAAFVAVGLCFMISVEQKSQEESQTAEAVYTPPTAGMSEIVGRYMESNGTSSVDLLATTAVASNVKLANEYYNNDGSVIGKLVVCIADEYAPIYLTQDENSGEYGKIYKNSAATLVHLEGEWCKIVSGGVTGYAKTTYFAFGKDAEALDAQTYTTIATVNTDELTLREEASTEAAALCILSPDSRHEVLASDEGDGWTKISVDGVGVGYVLTEYLDINTTHKMGITVSAERKAATVINAGIEEANAREDQRAAERAAEEEARAEARRQQQAWEDAQQAARDEVSQQNTYNNNNYYDDSYYYDDSDDYVSYYEEPVIDNSSVSSLRQSLVDYACSFAGWLPYVSGGASLESGADCSGFTSSIYAAFGYSIPRGSDAQSYCGRSVSLAEALPGDILVYSGHVAIYVGDGLKVHAPYPGQTVTVNSMYYMNLLDIRRVIED
ncbi:MAG: C40 family peptidase [Parasporobacterium sp.]|nr:C40 family peptidase [Parasporobacterium sp.]